MSQEKYFVGGKSIIGNIAENVEGVDPREYLMDFHIKSISSVLSEILYRQGIPQIGRIPEIIHNAAVHLTEEQFKHSESLGLPKELKMLLENDFSKKEQISLLKGISLKTEQLATLFLYASELGYKLNQYRFEGTPKKYDKVELPSFIYLDEDGTVVHTNETELTDGQLKEIVETSDFVLARLLVKDKHWHCFYQTKRGVAGKESGAFGSQSHFHYVSNSFGLDLKDVIQGFKTGRCPHSKVHLVLSD